MDGFDPCRSRCRKRSPPDLLSTWGKLRMLGEPLTGGARAGESVASYLIRKLGREAYDHLVGPLYGGLYGSDPADMVMELSLGRVLERFGVRRSLLVRFLRRGGRIAPPPAVSFREGMQTLPRAMAASLGGALRLGAPVRSIRRRATGWCVELGGETLEAEHVVLTVPAPAAARMLTSEAPDAAARIGALRYNSLVVVHLLAQTDLRGLGFQVSLAEDLPLRGVTFNDSLFGRAGVYTAYLGGAGREALLQQSDAELADLAVDQFRYTTGHDARAVSVGRESMPAWDRSWSHLQALRLPAGVHLATNWTSRPGIPGRLEEARRVADLLVGRSDPGDPQVFPEHTRGAR